MEARNVAYRVLSALAWLALLWGGASVRAAPPQESIITVSQGIDDRAADDPLRTTGPLSPCASTITRVSVASDGTQGDGDSLDPSASGDGRYVAFRSSASNLVGDDTNGRDDIFVHDRWTGETTLASVSSIGARANGDSFDPAIATDGRYVAFYSYASNLVSGDVNGHHDVFVHDRWTGETILASVSSDGTQGDGGSRAPSISADGRYVAFESSAANLVSGDTNGASDVFVHDRQTGETTLVSVTSYGAQGNGSSYAPSISAEGRYVAFESSATNLVSGDANDENDVFVHDRQTGGTTLVSVSSDANPGNGSSHAPSISDDGRYVAFYSYADNLISGDANGRPDVFVRDRQMGETALASVASDGTQGNGSSHAPSIAADGRHVTFESYASNLVSDDANGYPDVFLRDRGAGETVLVSASSQDTAGNGGSQAPSISADGRRVAFESYASNLVSGDSNGKGDVFSRDGLGPPLVVHLPMILRQWPPIPEAPALEAIDNPGGDGSYTVEWTAAEWATSYVLQETRTGDFGDAVDVYAGADTSYDADGRGAARYTYRVKARNSWGESGWSNATSADVLWEAEPNDDALTQANGPIVSGLTYYGTFPSAADEKDYFTFDLSAAHTVELWLTHIPSGQDYDLALRDAGLDLVALSDESGSEDEHILTDALPPGRYYVQVVNFSEGGSPQPYHLQVVYK